MRWSFLLGVVATLAAAVPAGGAVPDASDAYRIGVGDLIRVVCFQHDEISGDFPVEPSGSISFPLLGRVRAVGASAGELAEHLEELLERDFYVDVQLQVQVQEYRSRPVTLTGEVARPGTYYLSGSTSVMQLLAEAGGLKPTAGSVIEVRRPTTGGSDDQVWSLSVEEVLGGAGGGFLRLAAGDVVAVPARRLCFISGEVLRPGQYEITRHLTLMQALTQAGGLGKFASQTVELHREQGGEKQILLFDLSHIRKGREPDPPVLAGDVIIVKRRFF